jgi:hypothetical protein
MCSFCKRNTANTNLEWYLVYLFMIIIIYCTVYCIVYSKLISYLLFYLFNLFNISIRIKSKLRSSHSNEQRKNGLNANTNSITNEFTILSKKEVNVLAWLAAAGLCAYMLFCLYPDFKGVEPLTKTEHILYQSFSRVLWSLGLAYVIHACLSSNGGIKCFSYRFIFLSLAFCVFCY